MISSEKLMQFACDFDPPQGVSSREIALEFTEFCGEGLLIRIFMEDEKAFYLTRKAEEEIACISLPMFQAATGTWVVIHDCSSAKVDRVSIEPLFSFIKEVQKINHGRELICYIESECKVIKGKEEKEVILKQVAECSLHEFENEEK